MSTATTETANSELEDSFSSLKTRPMEKRGDDGLFFTDSNGSTQSPPLRNLKSSRPITLLELLKREKSSLVRRKMYGVRSCLKHDSITRTPNKMVRFATNVLNDKVWALAKPVDHMSRFSPEGKCVWYSPREFNRMLMESRKVGSKHKERMIETIQQATSAESTPEKDDEDEMINDIDLRVAVMSECSEIRGLERLVFKRLTRLHKDAHTQAVMETQAQIRGEDASSARFPNDSDWELLRKMSRKYSRPSRLIATKMAQFDAWEAWEAMCDEEAC